MATTLAITLIVLQALLPGGAAAIDAAGFAPAFSIGGQSFSTWQDYYSSDYFTQNGKRCGKPASVVPRVVAPSDCTYSLTNPSSDYDTVDVYEVPVVVHIIEHTNGDGQISDALVNSQIDVLNEDFLALTGTPGAPGFDVGIQFVLASTDPGGSPTTGITRSVNNTWFGDGGSYWNSLAWDTSRYMNVYTNNAGGNLGYVPDLPQGGIAGGNDDRVVILWSAFGRNSSGGPPYDQGRTLTHEVGHYLGLEHTFNGGCASGSQPGCYTSGDLICDTNSEQTDTGGCPGGKSSCGTPDPIDNYMDYSDDTCMEMFTDEQSHRMRCSLLNYRPDLYTLATPAVCGDNTRSGAEECDGTDDSACPGLCQVDCMCPPPVCGNDLIELGEECDGTDPGSCPTEVCDPDCTCEDPSCGNNVTEAGEECDGTDDAACPGLCEVSCTCPNTCNTGDLLVRALKSSDTRFALKTELDNSGGTYDGVDPRNQYSLSVTQGAGSVNIVIAALDAGWVKSKPEKGRYLWKGDLDGLRRIKAIDRSDKNGEWKIIVKGKAVPGAGGIDLFDPTLIDVQLTMDGVCTETSY